MLARRMVTEFGMSEKLGPLAFGKKDELVFLGREISEQRNYSDEVAFQIDSEIRRLVDTAHQRAREVVTSHFAQLEAIAELLVREETIEGDELEALFDTPRPKPNLVGPPATSPAASLITPAGRKKSRGRGGHRRSGSAAVGERWCRNGR